MSDHPNTDAFFADQFGPDEDFTPNQRRAKQFAGKLEIELAAEKEKKRQWSDEHTKNVIAGQVKEIDRLTELVKATQADREHIREWAIRCQNEMEHQSRLRIDLQADLNKALARLLEAKG